MTILLSLSILIIITLRATFVDPKYVITKIKKLLGKKNRHLDDLDKLKVCTKPGSVKSYSYDARTVWLLKLFITFYFRLKLSASKLHKATEQKKTGKFNNRKLILK